MYFVKTAGRPRFLLIFLAVLWVACQATEQNELRYTSQTINIAIPDTALSTYYHSSIYRSKEIDWFIGYNHTTHAFDIFDLSNQRYARSIALDTEGPDGIPTVGGFAANQDYIVAATNNTIITVITHEGKKISSTAVSQLSGSKGFSLSPTELTYGNYTRHLLTADQRFVVPCVPYMKRTAPTFYDSLKLLVLDISQPSPQPQWIDIDFPPAFADNFYSDLDKPYVTFNNERLMYNFPVSGEVYQLSSDYTESTSISFSEGEEPVTPPISRQEYTVFEDRMNHFFHSARYFYPLYDPWRSLYYIVRKETTDPASVDEEAAGPLKYEKNHLVVLDSNFNHLGEIKLPEFVTPMCEVTEQGVMFLFNSYNIESESQISFHFIDIDTQKD